MSEQRTRWWSHIRLHNDGLYFNPEFGDIVAIRHGDTPHVNIERRVAHHAGEAGIEWGEQAGKRGLDLALCILDVYLPAQGGKGRRKGMRQTMTRVWSGHLVSDDAFRLHKSFADRLVYPLPHKGGVIRGEDIRAFLRDNGVDWTAEVWLLKGRTIPDDSPQRIYGGQPGRIDGEARTDG